MAIHFIDLKTPCQVLKPQILARIHAVLEHCQYFMGSGLIELKDKLVAFTGANRCITCASGTEALHMSLMALGNGPSGEIVAMSFSNWTSGNEFANAC